LKIATTLNIVQSSPFVNTRLSDAIMY